MNCIRSALFAAGMLGLPMSVMADMKPYPLVGNWSGGAYVDDNTHQFARCIGTAPYRSGITMLVAMERNKGWSLGFGNNEWHLKPQAQIPLSITFDSQSPWSGTAIVLNENMVAIPMTADSRLLGLFRGAYQLSITAVGKVFQFNLDGTSRLMVSLSQCVETQLAIERGEPAPTFAAPPVTRTVNRVPPPPQTTQAPQGAENELLAMRLATNLLLEMKIPNAHLLSKDETPAEFHGRGVVWTSDVGIGGVMIFAAATVGKDTQQATTFLISNDASTCKGDFVSGRANELVDNTIVAKSTTQCKDSGGLHIRRYFTIPAPTAGDFIVFEIDQNGKPMPAPDSPLADTNFQAAAVKAAFVK